MPPWTLSLLRRRQTQVVTKCLRQYATRWRLDTREPEHATKEQHGHTTSFTEPTDDIDIDIDISELEEASYAEDRYVLSTFGGRDESSEPDLTPEEVRPPFAKAFVKVDNDFRTHRARRHGKKPLPLSPFIDPVVLESRLRWKMKKDQSPKRGQMTPFQRKLYINPYGMHQQNARNSNGPI